MSPRPVAISSGRTARKALALQLLGAFTVIAAALLDPLQAAIGVGGLVGVVLVDAGVHPRLAGAFLGIFRINGGGIHCRPGRRGGGDRRRGGCRGGVRSALGFAEIVPLLAAERAGGLGGLIFCTAFLRGQGLRWIGYGERGKTRD